MSMRRRVYSGAYHPLAPSHFRLHLLQSLHVISCCSHLQDNQPSCNFGITTHRTHQNRETRFPIVPLFSSRDSSMWLLWLTSKTSFLPSSSSFTSIWDGLLLASNGMSCNPSIHNYNPYCKGRAGHHGFSFYLLEQPPKEGDGCLNSCMARSQHLTYSWLLSTRIGMLSPMLLPGPLLPYPLCEDSQIIIDLPFTFWECWVFQERCCLLSHLLSAFNQVVSIFYQLLGIKDMMMSITLTPFLPCPERHLHHKQIEPWLHCLRGPQWCL